MPALTVSARLADSAPCEAEGCRCCGVPRVATPQDPSGRAGTVSAAVGRRGRAGAVGKSGSGRGEPAGAVARLLQDVLGGGGACGRRVVPKDEGVPHAGKRSQLGGGLCCRDGEQRVDDARGVGACPCLAHHVGDLRPCTCPCACACTRICPCPCTCSPRRRHRAAVASRGKRGRQVNRLGYARGGSRRGTHQV